MNVTNVPNGAAIAVVLATCCTLADAASYHPGVEARVKSSITIDGKQFKDLNANGKLDKYEDWRLPVEQRVDDLLKRMTLEEKVGLMLIDTLNASCQGGIAPVGFDYVNNQKMHRFIFRNAVTATPACGPDVSWRAGSSVTPKEAAQFMNDMQVMGENTRLGIPMLFKSNARNHIDPDARSGINEASGAFSAFPKEAGIAAAALGEEARHSGRAPTSGDMAPVKRFAQVMGNEWKAIGLRGMYGYMADLSTEPRWFRVHETFTEDADLNTNIMVSLVQNLQGPVNSRGESLSPDSFVALTMKHFPGGGPQELGLDPHYSFGKTQVYPGGNFEYHLKPFMAAIKAGVSSIMPYYGVPINVSYKGVKYDQVGYAFNRQIVTDLLRGELGFKGYVNSDTGIINDRAWGLEDKSVPERVATAVNGGTDTLSGFHDVKTITDLVKRGLITEQRVNLAARRLLKPLFQLGLFENPYVDENQAASIIGSQANRDVGTDLQRKSIVLLQNQATGAGEKVLPMKANSKVYLLGDFKVDAVQSYGYFAAVTDGNVAQRPSAAGHDYVIINVTAKNPSAVTKTYKSNDPATGLDPKALSSVAMSGTKALTGNQAFGAEDVCVAYDKKQDCTDSGLIFGGAFPSESGILAFGEMANSKSWQVVPALDKIQAVMREVGDPKKVILHVYFRQPFVLDDASGLKNAGAIIAGFGVSDAALLDVLSGKFKPQGRMPFALAKTQAAIAEQMSDLPGYKETRDGELYPFGFGLSY